MNTPRWIVRDTAELGYPYVLIDRTVGPEAVRVRVEELALAERLAEMLNVRDDEQRAAAAASGGAAMISYTELPFDDDDEPCRCGGVGRYYGIGMFGQKLCLDCYRDNLDTARQMREQ